MSTTTTMNAPSPLPGCVASLRSSLSLLESSTAILGEGVQDFQRMGEVLAVTRHFEVTSESQLVAAQEQVRGEIEPEVARLLDRVEGHLDRLARREDALIARTELLQGRIGDGSARVGSSAPGKRRGMGMGKGKGIEKANVPASAETPRDHRIEERLRALRQKKERLAFAVERLSLQAGQRERQLRKSMAG